VNVINKMVTVKNTMKQNLKDSKEINEFVKSWQEVMYQTGTLNKDNKTFGFMTLKKELYGYETVVVAPNGLSFEVLDKLKTTIENNMGCMFLVTKVKGSKTVKAKFIFDGFKNINFIPPKVTSYEVYIGNSVDGKPQIIDMRDYPHILLSGTNGSGKSRLLDCLLTTLICSCDTKEMLLYLVQLAKNDLVIYEDCIHCQAFCDNLIKADTMLTHVLKTMDDISSLIRPLRKAGKGSDVHDYNRLNPNNKIPTRYVVFDEYASITDMSNDCKETKALKQQIIGKVERIAQFGRALGVYQIVALQRAVATMLSPFVKSQSNLRISGKQTNQKSSEVAMDDSQVALDLDRRIFVYKTFDFDYVKTPTINDKIILQNIKPFLNPKHNNLFSNLEKLKKDFRTPEHKPVKTKEKGIGIVELPKKKEVKEVEKPKFVSLPIKFDNVDPAKITEKQKTLEENIANIPNYVPYNPPIETPKILDRSKFEVIKTAKSPKLNKGKVLLP